MMGMLVSSEKPASPEIIWRNPDRVHAYRRRHNFEGTDECALYAMQEFVQKGEIGYWVTISGLEVLAGGRIG